MDAARSVFATGVRLRLLMWMLWLLSACAGADEAYPRAAGRDAAADAETNVSEQTVALASDVPAWSPLAPDEAFGGRSLQQWAVQWGRWMYSQTSCQDPAFDRDGTLCDLYQDAESPVFYLAVASPSARRPRCVVPAGKAILVPLTFMALDNAGVAPPAQQTDAQLRDEVSRAVGSAGKLRLSIDGREQQELERFVIPATRFAYSLPPEPNWFSCNGYPDVEPDIDPAYIGGVFALLPPTAAGAHQLEFAGAITAQGIVSVNQVSIGLVFE